MKKEIVCSCLFNKYGIVTHYSSKLIQIRDEFSTELTMSVRKQDMIDSSLSVAGYFLSKRLETYIWYGVSCRFFDHRTAYNMYLEMLEESEDYKEEGEKLTEFSSQFVSVMDKHIGDLVYAENHEGWKGEVLPISYLCIGLFCRDNWNYLSENDLTGLSNLYTGGEKVKNEELYNIVMNEQLSLLQEIQAKGLTKINDYLIQGRKTFDAIFNHTESEVARLNGRVSISESEYQEYQDLFKNKQMSLFTHLPHFPSIPSSNHTHQLLTLPQLPLPPQKTSNSS